MWQRLAWHAGARDYMTEGQEAISQSSSPGFIFHLLLGDLSPQPELSASPGPLGDRRQRSQLPWLLTAPAPAELVFTVLLPPLPIGLCNRGRT